MNEFILNLHLAFSSKFCLALYYFDEKNAFKYSQHAYNYVFKVIYFFSGSDGAVIYNEDKKNQVLGPGLPTLGPRHLDKPMDSPTFTWKFGQLSRKVIQTTGKPCFCLNILYVRVYFLLIY